MNSFLSKPNINKSGRAFQMVLSCLSGSKNAENYCDNKQSENASVSTEKVDIENTPIVFSDENDMILDNVDIETFNIGNNCFNINTIPMGENLEGTQNEPKELPIEMETTTFTDKNLDLNGCLIEIEMGDEVNFSNVTNVVQRVDENCAPNSDHLPSDNSSTSDKENETISPQKIFKRKVRKVSKNKGEAYHTSRGKLIQKRALKTLRECRNKCSRKLPEEIREIIFQEYWALGDHDKRVSYVSNLINVTNKAVSRTKQEGKVHKSRQHTHKYHFQVHNAKIPVCKECFLRTLDETPKFIECAIKKKLQARTGIIEPDQRGRHSPPNKTDRKHLEDIRLHILSFPAYESHYSRRHTKQKYLAANLTLSIMYKLYCETTTNPKSLQIYTREFKKMNFKFKKPALDTCTTCDTLQTTIKNADTVKEKCEAEEKLKKHHDEADRAYEKKKADKEKCKLEPNMKVICFDLQQVLPVPLLSSGNVFYKRQLSVYNLTIHDCQTGESFHYMWHEAVAHRGANEIASCLYRFIMQLGPNVEHLIFYSDTCGGQNKNFIVISMFTYVLQVKTGLKTIEHKFLIPGHTHLECDSDHSVIERKSKKSPFPIYLPRDWFQLVRLCGSKNKFNVIPMDQEDFFDFRLLSAKKGILQKKKYSESEDLFNFRNIKWLKFESDFGRVNYKNSMDNNEPFLSIMFRKTSKQIDVSFVNLEKCYTKPLPISHQKKENLLALLSQMDKEARDFYTNLTTKEDEKDTDPDRLEDFELESDSISFRL